MFQMSSLSPTLLPLASSYTFLQKDIMNTQYRKPLAGTKLDYFDTRAAIDAIQPGAYAKQAAQDTTGGTENQDTDEW